MAAPMAAMCREVRSLAAEPPGIEGRHPSSELCRIVSTRVFTKCGWPALGTQALAATLGTRVYAAGAEVDAELSDYRRSTDHRTHE